MTQDSVRRLIALFLGVATIMAGVFTWRAGQLGSAAAFDDRQSVGQTLRQEQQSIEVGLLALGDARSYIRYLADYAEAAALDDQAVEAAEVGAPEFAGLSSQDAVNLRRAATVLAASAGVFGRQAVYAGYDDPQPEPLPFDFDRQVELLEAEVASGITSPGRLDPDAWATDADTTRIRARGLRIAAMLLMVGVLSYTVAEVTPRRLTEVIAGGLGIVIFTVTTVVTFATVY